MATCFGGLAVQRWHQIWGTSLGVCGLLGITDATATPPTRSYKASGYAVYGAVATPSFIWFTPIETLSAALSVPLIYRTAPWPAPKNEPDYTIDGGSSFLPALQIQGRYNQGGLYLAPQIGVLFKDFSALVFGVELGYKFH